MPVWLTRVSDYFSKQTQEVLTQPNLPATNDTTTRSTTKQLTAKDVKENLATEKTSTLQQKYYKHQRAGAQMRNKIAQQISREKCIVQEIPINVYSRPPRSLEKFVFKSEASYYMLNYTSEWMTYPVGMCEIISHPVWTYTTNYLTFKEINGEEWWCRSNDWQMFWWGKTDLQKYYGPIIEEMLWINTEEISFFDAQQVSQTDQQPWRINNQNTHPGDKYAVKDQKFRSKKGYKPHRKNHATGRR